MRDGKEVGGGKNKLTNSRRPWCQQIQANAILFIWGWNIFLKTIADETLPQKEFDGRRASLQSHNYRQARGQHTTENTSRILVTA